MVRRGLRIRRQTCLHDVQRSSCWRKDRPSQVESPTDSVGSLVDLLRISHHPESKSVSISFFPPQKNLKGGPVFWILFLLPNPSGGRSGRVTSMGPGSRPRRPRPRRRSLRSWGLTWRRAVHRSLETSGGRRKTPRWPRAAPAWTRGHLAGFARPYAHDLQGSTGHPERRSS